MHSVHGAHASASYCVRACGAGNGLVDKKEFRKAMAALGVKAEKAEINTLFDSFDADGGGTIEYAPS